VKMAKKIDIGKLIIQKLDDIDRSISWLARNLNCDRSNLHKKLNNDFNEIDLLRRISKILKQDFFAYYSEMLNSEFDLPQLKG